MQVPTNPNLGSYLCAVGALSVASPGCMKWVGMWGQTMAVVATPLGCPRGPSSRASFCHGGSVQEKINFLHVPEHVSIYSNKPCMRGKNKASKHWLVTIVVGCIPILFLCRGAFCFFVLDKLSAVKERCFKRNIIEVKKEETEHFINSTSINIVQLSLRSRRNEWLNTTPLPRLSKMLQRHG